MATYYAAHNAAGGGVGTIGDPYTLAELASAVTAGNTGLMMATGTYTPTATTTFSNSGSVSSRINIRGCASDGTDDGTIVTISGASLGGGVHGFTVSGSWINFANTVITGCPGDAVSSTGENNRYTRVRLTDCANGFTQTTINRTVEFAFSEIDNNTGYGYSGPYASRGSGVFRHSSIHHNGGIGVRLAIVGQLIGSLVYANGSHGVVVNLANSAAVPIHILLSTIHGNGANGIELEAGTVVPSLVIDLSIITGNTAFGLDYNGQGEGVVLLSRSGFYGNSAALGTGSLPSDCLTTDPTFTSVTSGSEDFTPTNTDYKVLLPGVPSGIGGNSYRWIGAIQPDSSGGGGSSTYSPFRSRVFGA